MNTLDIKQQLTKNKLDSIYYFTGDEWKTMSMYIQQIAQIANADIEYIDSVVTRATDIKHKSIINKKKCYVIRDDKEYLTNDKLWSKVTETNKDILIFIISNVDKRSKFYKQFKDNIVEFNKMNEQSLIMYLNNDITLKYANMHKLIEICEYDYGRILLEIDKIKKYGDDYDASFEELLKQGAISIPPKDAVFDLVDAVLERDGRRAYKLYEDCKNIGEANLVILLNLFNNLRAMYQIQSFKGVGDICQVTGLKQGQVYGCQKHMYRYQNSELIGMMRLVQKIESGIKQGKIDDDMSIDYLLANIF